MTTVYCVQHSEGFDYVPTKREARKLARACAAVGDDAWITAHVVTDRLPRRELVCALLNGAGWSAEQKDVVS